MDVKSATNKNSSELNEQQKAAVDFGKGPLLVIAGAGTGKTNTLAHRVARLIAAGVNPARILLLTFTRRAAAELAKRVETILNRAERPSSANAVSFSRPLAAQVTSRIWGGTFHAIANRLLRLHAGSMGLAESFTVLDRSDTEDLLNDVRSDLSLDKGDVRFPRKATCVQIYSRCVNGQESVEAALKVHFPWCTAYAEQLKMLFKSFTERKQQQNTLDYDDLLLYWHLLMQEEALAIEVRKRFDAVLVDEYQDTNRLQAQILQRLCPSGHGLTVVGDDAQSIYSFRAATVHNILDFPTTFPGTTVLKLEQNYRSTQPILEATNAVIALSPQRYNKDLFSARASRQKPRMVTLMDEDQQCSYIIGRILEHHEAGIALKRQAVLFRTAHHSDALEVELSRRNIPFVKYGGLKFLEAAHVKDVLCFLRLADNPRDTTSAFRLLQLLDGVGPAQARRAMGHLQAAGYKLESWLDFAPPAAASKQWENFVSLLISLAPDTLALAEQIAQVRRVYGPILEKRYDQSSIRSRDLEQLEQISSNFRSRTAMLADLTLDPPNNTQDLAGPPLIDEDYLILSTIHSAKGCEWDCVFLLHAADGNIPSDMSTGSNETIEEERRLFYVALTRAKDFLEVCFPLKYYHKKYRTGDKHSYAQLTRFLPPALLPHFELISLAAPPTAHEPARDGLSTEVKSKIAAMWI